MTFLFRTPVRNTDGPRVTAVPNPPDPDGYPEGPLLMRYVRRNGPAVCVIIDTDLTVREKQVPLQTELVAALYHYLGGHQYEITDVEKALLEAAGYTVDTI